MINTISADDLHVKNPTAYLRLIEKVKERCSYESDDHAHETLMECGVICQDDAGRLSLKLNFGWMEPEIHIWNGDKWVCMS
jgi:hypothetical protein